MRAIYSYGLDDNEPAYATHGDTWMAVVEWHSDGSLKADVLNQFGSATNRPESKHYNDQAPLFTEKKWRKALLERDEILKNASKQYWIGEKPNHAE